METPSPKEPAPPSAPGWGSQFRKHLLGKWLSGLLALIPFVAAVFVFRFALNLIAAVVAPMARFMVPLKVPHYAITGASVLVLLVLLYLIGLIATYSVGKKALGMSEAVFMQIPLLKTVYSSTKTAISALSMTQRASFRSVVMLEFPIAGCWSLAFVTGKTTDSEGNTYLKLFAPTAPNPTTGFFIMVREGDVIATDLSVEEGIQSVVTGGILYRRPLPLPRPAP